MRKLFPDMQEGERRNTGFGCGMQGRVVLHIRDPVRFRTSLQQSKHYCGIMHEDGTVEGSIPNSTERLLCCRNTQSR